MMSDVVSATRRHAEKQQSRTVEEKEAEVNDTGGEIAQLQAKRKEVHLPAIQLISYCIHTRLHTGLHTTLITRKEGGGGERY